MLYLFIYFLIVHKLAFELKEHTVGKSNDSRNIKKLKVESLLNDGYKLVFTCLTTLQLRLLTKTLTKSIYNNININKHILVSIYIYIYIYY